LNKFASIASHFSYTAVSLMQQEGWWSYELCYQNKIRQFHVEDEKEKVVTWACMSYSYLRFFNFFCFAFGFDISLLCNWKHADGLIS
jgi:hypothetical protein